jgi:hypothetical protein
MSLQPNYIILSAAIGARQLCLNGSAWWIKNIQWCPSEASKNGGNHSENRFNISNLA